jgi:hypothetical protein
LKWHADSAGSTGLAPFTLAVTFPMELDPGGSPLWDSKYFRFLPSHIRARVSVMEPPLLGPIGRGLSLLCGGKNTPPSGTLIHEKIRCRRTQPRVLLSPQTCRSPEPQHHSTLFRRN